MKERLHDLFVLLTFRLLLSLDAWLNLLSSSHRPATYLYNYTHSLEGDAIYHHVPLLMASLAKAQSTPGNQPRVLQLEAHWQIPRCIQLPSSLPLSCFTCYFSNLSLRRRCSKAACSYPDSSVFKRPLSQRFQ